MSRMLFLLVGVSTLACLCPSVARAKDVVASEEVLVPRERMDRVVQVRDVAVRDDVITGRVTNTSDQRLTDVHLLIDHLWVWNDEFHPGNDDRSTAEEYVVPGEIPPYGAVDFEYRTNVPRDGRDGHLTVVVVPTSVTTYDDTKPRGRGATAPPPPGERPTAGVPY